MLPEKKWLRDLRHLTQAFFFILSIYGGYALYAFTEHFITGSPFVERAPLVEGFLPIGALMGLKLWITTGFFDNIHPAGLVIFIAAILVSALFKKGFCGWICPIGGLSEACHQAGSRIFKKNFRPPKYIDYPLRSVKYILMAFFILAAFRMPAWAIAGFIGSPYWKLADIRMLWFFEHIGMVGAWVLGGLVMASVFVKNFWCRYACPYGALLGLVSFLSPAKVVRDDSICAYCGKCARVCPSMLPVDKKIKIRSPECTGCLTCVSACPRKGALGVKAAGRNLSPVLYWALLIVLFMGIITGAKLTGCWRTSVTNGEYRELIQMPGGLEHP